MFIYNYILQFINLLTCGSITVDHMIRWRRVIWFNVKVRYENITLFLNALICNISSGWNLHRPRTSRKRWNFYETRRVAKDSEEVYEARSVLTIVVLLELQDAVLLPSVAKELILKKGGLVGDGIG